MKIYAFLQKYISSVMKILTGLQNYRFELYFIRLVQYFPHPVFRFKAFVILQGTFGIECFVITTVGTTLSLVITYVLQTFWLLSYTDLTSRCVTREGEGGGLPCPFSKIGKKCPNLEKKCPDYGYLWVKFFI